MSVKIGYTRVSPIKGNDEEQLKNLRKYNLDIIYKEKTQLKDRKREMLRKLLINTSKGDVVYINSLDVIAWSTVSLLEVLLEFKKKGVELVSVKENLDTSKNCFRSILYILSTVVEFEKVTLRENQMEGIQNAKNEGKYQGRQSIEVDSKFIKYYNDYLKKEITTKLELSKVLEISRPTLDKLIDEYENKLTTNKQIKNEGKE